MVVYRGDLPFGREGRLADGLVLVQGQSTILTALAKDVYGKPTYSNPKWTVTAADVIGLTSSNGSKVGVSGLRRGMTDIIVQDGAARYVVRGVRVR